MQQNKIRGLSINHLSPYKSSLTREQYLFYEMRTTSKLMIQGLGEDDIVAKIIADNLFQYPTEKSLKRAANICISRLKAMADEALVAAIVTQPVNVAKQICLYAMMKHSRLVWDFMLTVVAEKYRTQDYSFSKADINMFFIRLQEQDDAVASWSIGTIDKLKQVLAKTLVETEYLDSIQSKTLNSVLLSSILENSIRGNKDNVVLPAFNCFE